MRSFSAWCILYGFTRDSKGNAPCIECNFLTPRKHFKQVEWDQPWGMKEPWCTLQGCQQGTCVKKQLHDQASKLAWTDFKSKWREPKICAPRWLHPRARNCFKVTPKTEAKTSGRVDNRPCNEIVFGIRIVTNACYLPCFSSRHMLFSASAPAFCCFYCVLTGQSKSIPFEKAVHF